MKDTTIRDSYTLCALPNNVFYFITFFSLFLLHFFSFLTTTTRHLAASSWSNTANLVDLFLTSRFIEYTGNLSLSRRLAHLRRVLETFSYFQNDYGLAPQSQQRCTRFGYLAPRCLLPFFLISICHFFNVRFPPSFGPFHYLCHVFRLLSH